MSAPQHPHDPFRPLPSEDAPIELATTTQRRNPAQETEPLEERKPRGRRGRRKPAAPRVPSTDPAEDELAAALAELDEKGTSGDHSAG